MYSTKRHCEYRVSGVRSTDSCSLLVMNIAWSIYRKWVYVVGGRINVAFFTRGERGEPPELVTVTYYQKVMYKISQKLNQDNGQ